MQIRLKKVWETTQKMWQPTSLRTHYLKMVFLVMRQRELPWPSGYELRLSLERLRVLILVKVIGGRQEGHPVQKCSLLRQSPN